jgi:hypothetical protein
VKTPTLVSYNGAGESFSHELHTVYDLLDVVRRRPGMYIGEPSILALQTFLSGFFLALRSVGADIGDGSPPYQDFHDWIAARHGLRESTSGWARILLSAAGSEETALDRFFTELDEFRRDRIIVLRSARVPRGTVHRRCVGSACHELRVKGLELEAYGRSPVYYLVELLPAERWRGSYHRSLADALRVAEEIHRVPERAWREVAAR